MNKTEQNKERLYQLISDEKYRPMKAQDIALLLGVPKSKNKDLREALNALLIEGRIQITKNGKYHMPKKLRIYGREKMIKSAKITLSGTYTANHKGFGFVSTDDGDIYISQTNTMGALHGDSVVVQLTGKRSRYNREGRIVSIKEHKIKKIVGAYQKCGGYGFVIPDNPRIINDIYIPEGKALTAISGDKVVVSITKYVSGRKKCEGEITDIIGHTGETGVDILSVAMGYDIPIEFPPKVLNQANRIKSGLIEGDFYGRCDLRDWTMVTIDGEDAKDLDDAVSLHMDGDNYILGVHIADVSNYVQEGSALDREALSRGTSIYLPDRVIPMLPKALSNGICSLNKGCDRLCISCIMTISPKGEIISHEIKESVICVNERMTYTDVLKILEHCDDEVEKRYSALIPMLEKMHELSKLRRSQRDKRGAINFDLPESKIFLDKDGRPEKVELKGADKATMLIEDFMLAANETIAKEFFNLGLPFVYRTHEAPDPDKIESALTFIRNLGYNIKKSGQYISAAEISGFLEQVRDTPHEAIISMLLLRAMCQACYTTNDPSHFALAADYYCHFTSPIRRYPDLQIHRIIRDRLRGRMTEERKRHYADILDDVSNKSTLCQKQAEEIERETLKLKKAEYMKEHLGECFEGIISSVTGWGMYVELDNGIEGLVHISTLPGYFEFDEQRMLLVNRFSKTSYTVGQSVQVKAIDADTELRTVDFKLL